MFLCTLNHETFWVIEMIVNVFSTVLTWDFKIETNSWSDRRDIKQIFFLLLNRSWECIAHPGAISTEVREYVGRIYEPKREWLSPRNSCTQESECLNEVELGVGHEEIKKNVLFSEAIQLLMQARSMCRWENMGTYCSFHCETTSGMIIVTNSLWHLLHGRVNIVHSNS